VRRFEPELLLVSSGFDAHVDDPLAGLRLSTGAFGELARRAKQLAPRVAAVLEGGYNLRTLPALVEAALEGFG
jgi:acetoin utilization deacetylase AcuC-like enzyme